MSRRKLAALTVAVASLVPVAAAGASILPVPETTVVQVETGQLGFSTYTVSHMLDGTAVTDVHAPGGRWAVHATGVTVTPQVDGTFTLGWPCPSTVADTGSLHMTRTLEGALVVVQAGTGWSYEFTSVAAQHTIVPVGACEARVVAR